MTSVVSSNPIHAVFLFKEFFSQYISMVTHKENFLFFWYMRYGYDEIPGMS
jgi:hypothetical protein